MDQIIWEIGNTNATETDRKASFNALHCHYTQYEYAQSHRTFNIPNNPDFLRGYGQTVNEFQGAFNIILAATPWVYNIDNAINDRTIDEEYRRKIIDDTVLSLLKALGKTDIIERIENPESVSDTRITDNIVRTFELSDFPYAHDPLTEEYKPLWTTLLQHIDPFKALETLGEDFLIDSPLTAQTTLIKHSELLPAPYTAEELDLMPNKDEAYSAGRTMALNHIEFCLHYIREAETEIDTLPAFPLVSDITDIPEDEREYETDKDDIRQYNKGQLLQEWNNTSIGKNNSGAALMLAKAVQFVRANYIEMDQIPALIFYVHGVIKPELKSPAVAETQKLRLGLD